MGNGNGNKWTPRAEGRDPRKNLKKERIERGREEKSEIINQRDSSSGEWRVVPGGVGSKFDNSAVQRNGS